MAFRQLPDPAALRKLVSYDPATGKMSWLPRTPNMFHCPGRYSQEVACRIWNTKNAGKQAFVRTHGRHLAGTLLGELHLAHRIAWAVHFGRRDFGMIDHINGNGADNRIVNLRLANAEINTQNAHQRNDCSSGVTGVHWHIPKWGKARWVARIQCGNRRIFLGGFHSFQEAVAARREAELRFGFGPVHGKART